MTFHASIRSCLGFVAIVATCCTPLADGGTFQVVPQQLTLSGNFERAQLLVTQLLVGAVSDHSADLTDKATFTSSDESVVTIDQQGRIFARGNGEAKVTVSLAGEKSEVPVVVQAFQELPDVEFVKHIRPILNKAGCAAAACHAAQHGQGGFKLSVLGYDAKADFEAISRDRMQRRINRVDPDASLLLKKALGMVSHGGGRRLQRDSVDFQTLRAWIAGGATSPQKDAVEVDSLQVMPARRVAKVGEQQQLRVVAHYGDGSSRDVTALCKYDSMDEGLLSVTSSGEVTTTGKGQAPIMVRFEGQAEISMFVMPYSDSVAMDDWRNNNFVDEHAANKFRELGLQPSPLCDDATFVRRAFLDAIGTLPTPDEALAFIESKDPNKRESLVDRLLGLTGDPALDIYNDQYAAFWTLKWSDLIRNNSNSVGEQGMWALHNWIRESFRTNKGFDDFVRELVTAKGSIYMHGPANYFRIHRTSSELTEATSQLFLGVRLECAKCHHHPFEKYSQADYYSMAAFFSRVSTKNSEEFGLFGRETVVLVRSSGSVKHPRTGQVMQPKPLDGEQVSDPLDLRRPLGEWLVAADNPWFARSIVNRYMGYLMGHGLVEPIDDMRSTNPPSNVALMNALADDFAQSGFDLKHLMRTIMTSRLYQLSSQPLTENAADTRFYSHYQVKRLAAEPLLDAIDAVTQSPTKFKDLPPGTRAIALPDAEYPNYFLQTFAKPRRASVCECERSPDESLAQALHTLNGDILAKKIADKNGRVAQLLNSKSEHEEVVRQLYLATLNRPPRADELEASREFLEGSSSPQECYEDMMWALINSKRFLFVH